MSFKTKVLIPVLIALAAGASAGYFLAPRFSVRSPEAGNGSTAGQTHPEVVPEPPRLIEVRAFFLNDRLDPEVSCIKVFPVIREVPSTQTVARAALTELLKGPTPEERSGGYRTVINEGVKIQSLTIEDGVARADFNHTLEEMVGGSCRVAAIGAQLKETLKQFPSVREVVISVDGRTEDILQP